MLGSDRGSGRGGPIAPLGGLLAGLVLGLAWLPAAAQVPAAQFPATPAPAEAVATLNFTQAGIPAEATAENGVLARDRALAAGRRAAWEKLLSEAGLPPVQLSDQRIDDLVSSIVIEQERTSPTRYSGRITVVFNPNRVRGVVGGGGGSAAAGAPPPVAAPAPASNWVEAVATYRTMREWLELQRRLRGAQAVASVDILAIAVDAARLRLGLRLPAPAAAGDLAALGIALEPAAGPQPDLNWRLGLAGGG